ncbi:MAG: phosphate signaling complex protein PhoU [Pseudomonadota bacterium]
MPTKHIVTSYDKELRSLSKNLIDMAELVAGQLENALTTIVQADQRLCKKVINQDDKVDEMQHIIDKNALRLLATRQPVAGDLREIVAATRIASDLERIGDYATNICRHSSTITDAPTLPSNKSVLRMGKLAIANLHDTMESYQKHDAKKALACWEADRDIDDILVASFRHTLTYMMEDPRTISTGMTILFMAKNVERAGDHVTNIAETAFFMITGKPFVAPHKRQKAKKK